MVQVIGIQPTMSTGGLVGQAIAQGLTKRLGLMEAENAFKEAQGDPLKLATAFARLTSVSPELARGAGPMYEAMLRNMQSQAIRKGAEGAGMQPQTQQPLTRSPQLAAQPEQFIPQGSMGEPIPLRETTPGIQEKGITAEETLPKPYWTPQQRLAQTRNYLNMGFLPDKAEQLAQRDEQAYMANPEQYQKRFELLEQKRKDSLDELKRQLETKTQKKGEELFKDIPGEYLIGMEKGLEKDIRMNPDKTVQQLADEWSTRALDTAKAKNQFKRFAATQGMENLVKGTTGLEKLNSYSKIFERSGNQEEYYNLLREDMKLSPQGSASIAYKNRPQIKNIIDKNVVPMTTQAEGIDPEKEARKLANLIGENLTPNDSLLSIVWEARKSNPLFDERAFFDQINRNSDIYNINPRQEREISEGASRILPYWGDILIFPWLGK